jgi:asparagine synthase (glutamine-hydrolysing)
MCGLAGFLSPGPIDEPASAAAVRRMTARIAHRGPDDEGVWVDAAAGIALGHRRLSIVDLSAAGHQPMASQSGRHVVVFNGEIYNFAAIRRELEASPGGAPAWRGHSDTEVLLAAVERWGLVPALERFVGMFAFALWDRQDRVLHLARDRAGEKPLSYGWSGGALLFGSEVHALAAYPGFRADLSRPAVAAFLRYGNVPAPLSIYAGVHKLPPATVLTLRAADLAARGAEAVDAAVPVPYWSARAVAEEGQRRAEDAPDEEVVGRLEELLREAVGQQMLADVPLGAFLSGGVDSSLVVALMQRASSRPVRTFSIGFRDRGYDEAPFAREVARHLGTDHTELYVTEGEAMSVIPRLGAVYDEPFADASQVPTILVSRLAREHVTVALSGDAGDELFGGYTRYAWAGDLKRWSGRVPAPVRRALAGFVTAIGPRSWDRAFAAAGRALPARLAQRNPGDKLHKLAEVLGARDGGDLYRRLVSHWIEPARVVLGAAEPVTIAGDPSRWADVPGEVARMMFADFVSYLPDDILVKVDRAAMSVSLETRVPLLDHRIVEYAWSLPARMKLRGGVSKWALREVLYRHVPRALIERPKTGFSVPLDAWLREGLRDWAEALLDEGRLRREGVLDPAPIVARWREHLAGRRNWSRCLWAVLMFQCWRESAAR